MGRVDGKVALATAFDARADVRPLVETMIRCMAGAFVREPLHRL